MTEYVIETQNLQKSFGEVQVLSGIDLKVERNSIYGFLGPNGAGKTTTIKMILGLLKPSSGNIWVFNKDLKNHELDIKRKLGYLPQHPQFYEYLTAREILDYTMKFYFDGPQQAINDRIELLLDLVSISKKADRSIRGFSGGERRRLGIAQSMVNFPKLLILDEPAAALDPIGRKDVLNIMEQLRDYTTIFYSTHILDDVQKVSDKVAILNNGHLIAEGDIDHLLLGSDGTTYDIQFVGDEERTRKRIGALDYVNSIQAGVEQGNNHISWLVAVDDEKRAQRDLLRSFLEDREVEISQFIRKKYELEDIFMQVVEE